MTCSVRLRFMVLRRLPLDFFRIAFRAATGLGAGFATVRFLARGFFDVRFLFDGFAVRVSGARLGAETFAAGLFATRFLVATLLAGGVLEDATCKADSWVTGVCAAASWLANSVATGFFGH